MNQRQVDWAYEAFADIQMRKDEGFIDDQMRNDEGFIDDFQKKSRRKNQQAWQGN